MPRRLLLPLVLLLALTACGAADARDPDIAVGPPPGETAGTAGGADADASGTVRVGLRRIGTFSQPVYVTAPPRDRNRVFVVEQGGTIRIIRRGRRLSRPFLDVRGQISAGGEQGLLSLAFHPDHAENRRFYVYVTNRAGDTRVWEYRTSRSNPNRADPRSRRTVLAVGQPEANHNGGLLLFGPDDLLYIGLGDGGGAGDRHGERGNGQDLGTLLGKILRIDPVRAGRRAYRIPRDNPFRTRRGARDEIYAYGLRNPWRFSFDRRTGDLAIGDVGQGQVEEVNFARRGQGAGDNYGWRPFEGSRRFAPGEDAPGHVKPVIELLHDDGYCSITGGVVVRDRALGGLYGRYVFGDFCDGRLLQSRLRTGSASDPRQVGRLRVPNLSSFGEDGRGRVYALSLGGPVYRLVAR